MFMLRAASAVRWLAPGEIELEPILSGSLSETTSSSSFNLRFKISSSMSCSESEKLSASISKCIFASTSSVVGEAMVAKPSELVDLLISVEVCFGAEVWFRAGLGADDGL